MIQAFIVVFGLLSIFLANEVDHRARRWACIAGMLGQPFWFIATYEARQWGIFALAFFYTWAWGRGFNNFWLKPWLAERADRKAKLALWDQATGKDPW